MPEAIASWPASGQVLTEMPARVTVAYDTQFLPPMEVTVADPFGASVADGASVAAGASVEKVVVITAKELVVAVASDQLIGAVTPSNDVVACKPFDAH